MGAPGVPLATRRKEWCIRVQASTASESVREYAKLLPSDIRMLVICGSGGSIADTRAPTAPVDSSP